MVKCDMHLFWVWVYDQSAHMHRDPVANVVIYSAFAFFGACLGLAFGVPTYTIMRDDFPCVSMPNGDRASMMDTCHFILAFCVACYTILAAIMGIMAGEFHKPTLYSVFGGLGFVACWAELYAFSAVITQIVLEDNRNIISALDYAATVNGLGAVAIVGHGLALMGMVLAVRYAWLINFHFTRQDKLVYAEHLRIQRARKAGKENAWHGVADLDDDHEFDVGGMTKGLSKMFEAKEKEKRDAEKRAEREKFEQDEEERVAREGKANIM